MHRIEGGGISEVYCIQETLYIQLQIIGRRFRLAVVIAVAFDHYQ